MEVIAHRGASGHFPENTLPSFLGAIESGCDGIEMDVHLSKDNQLVVIHDEAIDRTSNGTGLVRDFTLAELRTYDFSNEKYAGSLEIPTLLEVLNLLQRENYQGFLLIEIKTDHYFYPEIERKVVELVMSRKWSFTVRYCSFNLESLTLLHDLLPESNLAYLVEMDNKKIAHALTLPYIDAIHPYIGWLKQEASEMIQFPLPIRVWTVNSKNDWEFALSLDIAGVITNLPVEAMACRERFRPLW